MCNIVSDNFALVIPTYNFMYISNTNLCTNYLLQWKDNSLILFTKMHTFAMHHFKIYFLNYKDYLFAVNSFN